LRATSLLLLLFIAAGAGTATQAASTADEPAAYLPGKVTRVIDGDTIDVLLASGRIRVRLHGIDAPEGNQPGGAAASAWLRQQLRDEQVLLEPVSQDQYDRLVAVVHLQERNINRELVSQGHAWAYRRYMRRSDRELCSLEYRARRGRAGLWAAAAAHAPWEHRSTRGKGPFASYDTGTALECRKAIGKR
jgi:endonuclease YncB( thermonuclease family)